ncbi:MAG: DUF4349 domain-containing protein [Clostridiales bacterium]|jgi:hypothetical protein|nr:DUF4349 domain-containing protein [Clostridiales bacterium]
MRNVNHKLERCNVNHKLKRFAVLAFVLAAMLLAAACGAGGVADDRGGGSYPSESEPGLSGETSEITVTAQDRKIIYTLDIYIWCDDITQAVGLIESSLSAADGEWRESANISKSSAFITVRVKSERLSEYQAAISMAGEVTDYNLSSRDVSLEYSDLQGRLDSLRTEEEALNEMLAAATSTAMLLQINQRLAEVRYSIESITSSIKGFDSKVSYSTVNIRLNVNPPAAAPKTFGERLGATLSGAWGALLAFLGFLVNAAVALLPFSPLIAAAVGVPIFVYKRKKKKKEKAAVAAAPFVRQSPPAQTAPLVRQQPTETPPET